MSSNYSKNQLNNYNILDFNAKKKTINLRKVQDFSDYLCHQFDYVTTYTAHFLQPTIMIE